MIGLLRTSALVGLLASAASAEIIAPPSQGDWVGAKKTVQVNDRIETAYVEWGDTDAEPVVLIHGYSDNSRAWSTISPFLMDRHYFAIDLRGHGDSSEPACCYYVSDFAEDTGDFIDTMALGAPVVVGHSLGSLTAGVLASAHPEQVGKLVLVSAALKVQDGVVDWIEGALADAEFPLDPESAFMQAWAYNPGTMNEAMLGSLRLEEAAMPEQAWRVIARGLQLLDWTSAARHVSAPTLILWGDQDEMMIEADQDALRASLPGAEFIRYDGLGHSMYWEDPERVAKDLQSFMSR